MSPEEQTRYEFFSRSHFNRAVIKGIMSQSIGPIAPSDEMVIAVSSLSKAFVGDLVEEGIF